MAVPERVPKLSTHSTFSSLFLPLFPFTSNIKTINYRIGFPPTITFFKQGEMSFGRKIYCIDKIIFAKKQFFSK